MGDREGTSSLMTKGSNPGPHASAIGDTYESFLSRQIAVEYKEFEESQQPAAPNAPSGNVGTPAHAPRNQRTLQDLGFDYAGVDVITRRFHVGWNFSLNEAVGNPSVTRKTVTRTDWPSFQRKRVGDLDNIIFKSIKVVQVQTSSPDCLALVMDGIKGRSYGIGTGVRTPFFINPESNAYEINALVHQLDEKLMKMADLRFTKMSREYLDRQAIPLPNNPAMSAVPVNSDITDVLRQQKNPMIPKLKDIPVFAEGTHYVLNTKLVEKCKDILIEKRGNISLPTTSLYDWEIGLERADGLKWADTDVAMKLGSETGLLGEELLDYRINTNIVLEAEFFNASGDNWDQKLSKSATAQ